MENQDVVVDFLSKMTRKRRQKALELIRSGEQIIDVADAIGVARQTLHALRIRQIRISPGNGTKPQTLVILFSSANAKSKLTSVVASVGSSRSFMRDASAVSFEDIATACCSGARARFGEAQGAASGLLISCFDLTQYSVPAPLNGSVSASMSGKVEIDQSGCPGLGARLQGSARRWVVRYRVAGNPKQRQVTLGPMSGMSLRKARETAVEYTGAARRGVDHAVVEEEEAANAQRLAKSRAEGLLTVIVDRYLKHAETQLRSSTFKDLKRYLTISWAPLHDEVVSDLDARSIVARLEVIADESGPVAANRARSALSQCLAWSLQRGVINRNPLIGTRAIAKEKPRERVLSLDEIATLWAETNRPGDFSTIVRLLLLTAQRREEVAAMRWSEVDLDRRIWELPGARTKNGRPHQVPLSDQVAAILESLERRDGRDLVFGKGEGGFSGWGQSKARSDRRSGLRDWRLHDLRRTAVTVMGEIGVQPHVVEAIVNHISGHRAGVAGIYNRATYAAEKKSALQRWANHIEQIAAGSSGKVIRLPT